MLAVASSRIRVGDECAREADEPGASSADRRHGYDRHWRNARVHTIRDANDWRLVTVGDWAANGVLPPKPVREGG